MGWYSSSSSYYDDPPLENVAAEPGVRKAGSFGPASRVGIVGLVAGRFLPLHRGHQLVIDFARRSVQNVFVAINVQKDDEITGEMRASWISALYPDVNIRLVPSKVDDVGVPPEFETWMRPFGATGRYVFASDLAHRAFASALGAEFVPVDPTRGAVPVSGSALRANLLEHFAYVAPSARTDLVRRVAVIGAESTGKSALCARLREDLKATVVPEYLRTFSDAGKGTFDSESLQMLARTQVATEEALAKQSTSGILVADTELYSILLWSRRMFEGEPPAWIGQEASRRVYDLYLLCSPDIPFIGPGNRDLPRERNQMHDDLAAAFAGEKVVLLTGSREERYEAAADAIISLYAGKLRGARLQR